MQTQPLRWLQASFTSLSVNGGGYRLESYMMASSASRFRTEDVQAEKSFSDLGLPASYVAALSKCGFDKPSPVQEQAIPLGCVCSDLIVQAKSGTGKTVVFSTICLQRVKPEDTHVQALILAPTRELAIQSEQVINRIAAAMSDPPAIQAAVFVGGLPIVQDEKRLRRVVHIAVGTPGRVLSLIQNGTLKVDKLSMFVLDEADALLDDSMYSDVTMIYDELPRRKQVMAFSATYTDTLLQDLEPLLKRPQKIMLCEETVSLKGVRQYYHLVDGNVATDTPVQQDGALQPLASSEVAVDKAELKSRKVDMLLKLVGTCQFHQASVFCNDKPQAEWLSRRLAAAGFPAVYLGADLAQEDRQERMKKVRDFEARVVVSTDVLARGIDLDRINLVINMDLPRDAATYVHRVGRTGRFGTRGVAVCMVTHQELEQLKEYLAEAAAGDIDPLPDKVPIDLYAYELQSEWERQALEKLQQAPVSEEPPPPPPSDSKVAKAQQQGGNQAASNGVDTSGLPDFINFTPEALQAAKQSKKMDKKQQQALKDISTAQAGIFQQQGSHTYAQPHGYGYASPYGANMYGVVQPNTTTHGTDAQGSAQSWQQYWEYCTAYYQQYGQYPAELYSLYEQHGNAPDDDARLQNICAAQQQPQSLHVAGRTAVEGAQHRQQAQGDHKGDDTNSDEDTDEDADDQEEEEEEDDDSGDSEEGADDTGSDVDDLVVGEEGHGDDSSYANDDYLDLLAGDDDLDDHAAQLIQGITFKFPATGGTAAQQHQQGSHEEIEDFSTERLTQKGTDTSKGRKKDGTAGVAQAQKVQVSTDCPIQGTQGTYEAHAGSPGQSTHSRATHPYPYPYPHSHPYPYPAAGMHWGHAHNQAGSAYGYYSGLGHAQAQYGHASVHQPHHGSRQQPQPDYSYLYPGLGQGTQQQQHVFTSIPSAAAAAGGYQYLPTAYTSWPYGGTSHDFVEGAARHANPYHHMCTACAMQQYTKQYNAWLEQYTAWYHAFIDWQAQLHKSNE